MARLVLDAQRLSGLRQIRPILERDLDLGALDPVVDCPAALVPALDPLEVAAFFVLSGCEVQSLAFAAHGDVADPGDALVLVSKPEGLAVGAVLLEAVAPLALANWHRQLLGPS